jgi:DNA-binding Lrp family transcriptional regulator
MEEKTRELLRELQNGFKLETRPFLRIANKLGYSENQVLQTIKDCIEEGIIRRIGAAVRPEKMGHSCNALVVWQVAADKIDEVGNDAAGYREISHCYERECPPNWPYNFFTMIHAKTDEELKEIIQQIAQKHELSNYKVYATEQELKKTSMRYFPEESDGNDK